MAERSVRKRLSASAGAPLGLSVRSAFFAPIKSALPCRQARQFSLHPVFKSALRQQSGILSTGSDRPGGTQRTLTTPARNGGPARKSAASAAKSRCKAAWLGRTGWPREKKEASPKQRDEPPSRTAALQRPRISGGRHASRFACTMSQRTAVMMPAKSMTALYFQAAPITIGTSSAEERQKAAV